jgi:hypothetical protein
MSFVTTCSFQYRYLCRPNARPFLPRMRKTTPVARMIRPIVQKIMLIVGKNSETSKLIPKTITSSLPPTLSIPASDQLHADGMFPGQSPSHCPGGRRRSRQLASFDDGQPFSENCGQMTSLNRFRGGIRPQFLSSQGNPTPDRKGVSVERCTARAPQAAQPSRYCHRYGQPSRGP